MIVIVDTAGVRQYCPVQTVERLLAGSPTDDDALMGQARARGALDLGLGIRAEGFNVFVAGEQGSGKLHAVKTFLERQAAGEPVPDDWCHVNNFDDPYHPIALRLPPGRGQVLRKDMRKLVEEAVRSLVKAFESEEYMRRRQTVSDKYEKEQAGMHSGLAERAEREHFLIRQTPWEIFSIPLKNGEPMTDQDFDKLPEAQQAQIRKAQESFTSEIEALLKHTRRIERAAEEELSRLEMEVAGLAVTGIIAEVEEKYATLPDIVGYLHRVRQDILENLAEFLLSRKPQPPGLPLQRNEFSRRYEVNVVVDNARQAGAPVVIEHHPTYNNLVGHVEKESVMGTLVTDFTMVRRGALHVANGGYLILRAEELFRNYFTWEALKRALRNRQVTIEEAADQLGYFSTKSLRPEPIPLDVKVVLVGTPPYYHLLHAYDPDFRMLFKVKADFDPDMARTDANTAHYLAALRSMAEREGIRMPDAAALAKLVEQGSRMAIDRDRLTTRFEGIADVLREAGHYASKEDAANVGESHVLKAIERRIYRSNLIQEKVNEMVSRRELLIDTKGVRVGQVNGLSVLDLGDIAFGRPVRITATVNPGKSGVVAIEREAELSGPIHTKGVLILSGYLAETFFQSAPVSLSARLVFEQSYSEVEGDSASSTELYALLSNLARLPVRQGIAVTGSINQKGDVQAIGGVNEKIEGYFELCRLVGLDGEQGVIIPSANLRQLMLKEDVVEAVREGRFRIWAVDTVDDGIEVLTGVRAGSLTEEGTVKHLVAKTLEAYAERMSESGLDNGERKVPGQGSWVSDVVMG
jgi:predicted ATP-dependent protease